MEQHTTFIASRGILKSCVSRNRRPVSSMPDIDQDLLARHRSGGSIYVCTEALHNFANNYFDRVDSPFVLVSGDSDLSVDDALLATPAIARMLDSGRLLAWYAQNLRTTHPLLHALPIGLDYHTMWEKPGFWGLTAISPMAQENTLINTLGASPEFEKRYFRCYCNWHFAVGRDRAECHAKVDQALCFYEPHPVTRNSTWLRQAEFMFVISPEGGGMDCHRTWEALMLGCVPVVRRNALSPLFDRLPVLVVDDWAEVTRERLSAYANRLQDSRFEFSPLFRDYWMSRIHGRSPEFLDEMSMAEFRKLLTRKTG